MKKLLLFVILALGACMTASAQDAQRRFNRSVDFTLHIADIIGGKLPEGEFKVNSGITKYQTKDKTVLIGKEILIEISRTSVFVESIHGSKFLNRSELKTFTVASNITCGGHPGCHIVVENNMENTVIYVYLGNERVIDSYRVHQYQPKPINRQYGGVNHRSTHKPRRLF